jgi:hypothetical protein
VPLPPSPTRDREYRDHNHSYSYPCPIPLEGLVKPLINIMTSTAVRVPEIDNQRWIYVAVIDVHMKMEYPNDNPN